MEMSVCISRLLELFLSCEINALFKVKLTPNDCTTVEFKIYFNLNKKC